VSRTFVIVDISHIRHCSQPVKQFFVISSPPRPVSPSGGKGAGVERSRTCTHPQTAQWPVPFAQCRASSIYLGAAGHGYDSLQGIHSAGSVLRSTIRQNQPCHSYKTMAPLICSVGFLNPFSSRKQRRLQSPASPPLRTTYPNEDKKSPDTMSIIESDGAEASEMAAAIIQQILGTHAQLLKLKNYQPGHPINGLLSGLVDTCSETCEKETVRQVRLLQESHEPGIFRIRV